MLYAIPGCPVDNYDKDWIEKTLVWYEEKLGKTFIKNREYLIPANYKFKHLDFKSHEAIQYFIDFICSYLDLDPALVGFEIQWYEAIDDGEGLPDDFDVDAIEDADDEEPVQILIKEGKYIIEIGEDLLDDFDGAFYTLASQLTYISLTHKKVFTFYNALMINYAMVLLGFGVMSANIFVRTWQWHGLRYSAWATRGFGIINHRMYGYLFAFLIKYRNKPAEPWLQYLASDVVNFYNDAAEFLEENNSLLQLPIHAKDEQVFIEKSFHEGGAVRLITHVVNNKLEGSSVSFYENGMVWHELIYKNNVPYTVLSNHNPYDELVEKGTLLKGNGTLYIYNPDGNLNRIEEYRDGNRII
jgi:hypothetical protein